MGCVGNRVFEGYCIDLLNRLAKDADFEFELYLSPDGKYGSEQPDGSWNGIVRELILGHAVLGIGPITVTMER